MKYYPLTPQRNDLLGRAAYLWSPEGESDQSTRLLPTQSDQLIWESEETTQALESPWRRMHQMPEAVMCFRRISWGFPGGAVVENLPANAGDTGSSPGLGRSHMPRSNWAREPQLLSLRLWSLCSATREAAIVRGPRTAMKSGPRSPQLEKALAQKRRPNTAINK